MNARHSVPRILIIACVLLAGLLAGCGREESSPTPPAATATPEADVSLVTATPQASATPALDTPATPEGVRETPEAPPATEVVDAAPTLTPSGVTRVRLASFSEPGVRVVPNVEHEPITPDLGNVRVGFVLSDEQRERLARDGFVVSPGIEKEFFTVYEKARYNNEPIFVTSDSLLHVYHLLFDKVLRTTESQYFIPLLRELNAALLAQLDTQYQELDDDVWKEAARRSVAFVGVASRLLDPSIGVPDYAEDLVAAELELIEAAEGIQPSPLFPALEFGEDYTQYIPRGHYTRSEALSAYFRSMMWYGRMTFRLNPLDAEAGRAETRSALLLVHALRNATASGEPALALWQELYEPTVFFVGRSDDLTALQYGEVMDNIYGASPSTAVLADEDALTRFIEEANRLPPPRVLGMVISVEDEEEAATKGLRFMGQRFVPDAYIFRQLIFRNVGTLDNPRLLPKGLDIFAALGSERAYEHLETLGETEYENYPEQMEKVRGWVEGLTVEEWTETLYNTWLYSFLPLLEQPGEGYPAFAQSPAWVDKQLNTVLGSWAELKHDTILYAKQVYAEMGAGPMPPEPVPPVGYVEPVPTFFARIGALTRMTREGLQSRGLLSDIDAANLERLEELAGSLKLIADKELQGAPLTQEQQDLIRFYGGTLEHLTMAASADDDQEFVQEMEEEPQAAVIADVATAPDTPDGPLALEVGVGRVDEIHVVVPITDPDGTRYLQVAKGGVFSYYEFPQPISERLTDEAWREMLDAGEAPPREAWITSFFTEEGEFSDLTEAVTMFRLAVIDAYWDGAFFGTQGEGAAIESVEGQIAPLVEAGQFAGHQLLRSEFRSFDRPAYDQAIVTTRETWQDELYDSADFDLVPLAARGPYSLDVTYTLERRGSQWVITNVVTEGTPPAWE